MSNDRAIADLCPELQPLAQQFLDKCQESGLHAFITQTYRCAEDQDEDYAQGRTAPGHIITNARAGESPHNCMLTDGSPGAKAFDFAIQDASGILDWDASDSDWQTAIKIGESLGLISGSTWCALKDCPHFELPNWKNI